MLCVTLFDKEQSQSLFHFCMGLCIVAKETALSVSSPQDNFSDYIVCCPLNVDKNICFLFLLILVNCGNYYL